VTNLSLKLSNVDIPNLDTLAVGNRSLILENLNQTIYCKHFIGFKNLRKINIFGTVFNNEGQEKMRKLSNVVNSS